MIIVMPPIRALTQRLLWALMAIHGCSLAANVAFHGFGFGKGQHLATWLTKFFNVNELQNLPAWFSSGVLLLTAWLLWEVASASASAGQRRFVRHWRILSLLFVAVSIDDMTDAHRLLRTGPVAGLGNASSWLLVLAPAALLFAVAYVPFWRHLPATIRWIFAGSAGAYVLGVTAVELVGVLTGRNLLAHLPGQALTGQAYVRYLLAASVEELIQGLAVIVFLYAVGSHLQRLRELDQAATSTPDIALVRVLTPQRQDNN